MKRLLSILALTALLLSLAACGGGGNNDNREHAGVDKLVSEYGFQWSDPTKPILNEKGLVGSVHWKPYSETSLSTPAFSRLSLPPPPPQAARDSRSAVSARIENNLFIL